MGGDVFPNRITNRCTSKNLCLFGLGSEQSERGMDVIYLGNPLRIQVEVIRPLEGNGNSALYGRFPEWLAYEQGSS